MSSCPGQFCGRVSPNASCGICMNGYRALGPDSLCKPCTDPCHVYDYLYLAFMAILPLIITFYHSSKISSTSSSIIYQWVYTLLSLIIIVVVSTTTLLIFPPVGKLYLYRCESKSLADWYTYLYNPKPDLVSTLNCSYEAVYPLFSVVLVYYAIYTPVHALVHFIVYRDLIRKKHPICILGSILYCTPILLVMFVACCGLIYYAFPYIVLALSTIYSAFKFVTMFPEENELQIIKKAFLNINNFSSILIHWSLSLFGIVALTGVNSLTFFTPLLAIIPLPLIIFIVSLRFTKPTP